MPVTDTRQIPLARTYLYGVGAGDPRVTDRGLAWYDILRETRHYGTYSLTNGQTALEYLDGCGLVCRAFVHLKDTRSANYSTSGGSWEERRPSTGVPRVYLMVQYDTSTGVVYSATSGFQLPSNPSVAFSFILPDSPADWDDTTYPPFVRVEFGGGLWAVQFSKGQGNQLLKNVGGVWTPVLDVPEPTSRTYSDAQQEKLCILRCHRGRIFLSLDGGREYVYFANPDGSAITVAASSFTVRGQGGQMAFGLHQVLYNSGTYTSQPKGTIDRGAGSATISGKYTLPSGTSISFTDVGTIASRIARWRASFTPATSIGTPFTFYRSPELYSVLLTYPVVATPGTGASIPYFENSLETVQISRPLELDQGSCTLQGRWDPSEAFVGDFSDRKMLVQLGHHDGTLDIWERTWVGYIRDARMAWQEHGRAVLTFSLENPACRFKDAKWEPLDERPLGGMTVNAALDYILTSEGLAAHLLGLAAYRSWSTLGDLVTLPEGAPEEPVEMLRRGESKWETMVRLAGYLGLELAVRDDGVLITLAKDYASTVVTASYKAEPDISLVQLVQSVTHGTDYRERGTSVTVYAGDEAGQEILVQATDSAAETNPASGRFSPWRKNVVEGLSGTPNVALATLRAQGIATELLPVKYEADLRAPVGLAVNRRDRVQVDGCETVGIPSGSQYVVLTLEDTYAADPSFGKCGTTAGLRRIG